jgi:hypothetical protein
MIGKHLAHQALILSEDARIGVSETQEQLGAALDIAEQEGNGAGGERRCHGRPPVMAVSGT